MTEQTLSTRRWRSVAVVIVVALATAACTAGDTTPEVATVSSTTVDGPGPSDAPNSDGARDNAALSTEDAVLAYAECMRDHGVDFQDPQFLPDGSFAFRGVPTADEATMNAANEACQPILADVVSESHTDPQTVAENQDRALEFAACMRDHGIDFPDPEASPSGDVVISGSDFDPSDPDFQAALAECQSIFGGLGGTTDGGYIGGGG